MIWSTNPKIKLFITIGLIALVLVAGGSLIYTQVAGQRKAIYATPSPADFTLNDLVSPSPAQSPVPSSTLGSLETKPDPIKLKPDSTATNQESCSPRGTATCNGEGRSIATGGNASNNSSVGLAAGVVKLTDVGLKKIELSSGGTNGLDIDFDTGLVYTVTNSTVGSWCNKPVGKRADLLSIVDPVQGKEIAAIATDKGPVWPWVDVSNDAVIVATSSEGIIARHKRGSGEKLGTIKVGGLPHDVAVDSQSNIMLVSNTNDGSQKYVAAVDAKTQAILGQHQVAELPHRIALDSSKHLAYVMSVGSGTISVFDSTNGQPAGQFNTGGKGTMAFSSSTRRLFVPSGQGQTVGPETILAINADTHESVGTISAFLTNPGHQAFGLTVDEKNKLLFASLGDSPYVGIADLNTLKPLAVIETGDCTWGIKIDEKRQVGYVTDPASGLVSQFDLNMINQALKR